jgi:hypothetical protein
LLEKVVYLLSNQKFDLKSLDDEIILIDVYFLMNKPHHNNAYFYDYFDGLDKILDERKINYVYLPIFVHNKSIYKFYNILKLVKNNKLPILTEYQLLSLVEYLKLLQFIMNYPMHVLKLVYGLRNNSKKNQYLKYHLLYTLDQVTFQNFVFFLKGKKLSSISWKHIRMISKYENQVIDKNIYKGLRSSKTKVSIYGCQLFIYPFSLLNIHADPNEIPHGVVPDKVLVNGNYYLYENSRINSVVGPSFRYKYIFQNDSDFNLKENLIILLPYIDYECRNILQIVRDIDYQNGEIIIKFHPTMKMKDYKNLIPKNVKISNKTVSELFQNTNIIISNESGSLVEAVSLCIPAIVIKNKNRYLHNPLSAIGKGIIWDSAECAADVNKLINKFQHSLNNEKEDLAKYANKYKDMFFCEPTEKKIIDAFDL